MHDIRNVHRSVFTVRHTNIQRDVQPQLLYYTSVLGLHRLALITTSGYMLCILRMGPVLGMRYNQNQRACMFSPIEGTDFIRNIYSKVRCCITS